MSAPLRLGLVGAGGIARSHRTAALAHPAQITLAAVCDVDEGRARAAAADAPGCLAFDDWRRMLREARLDAVTICLPHALHLEVSLAALDAGLHVLVEKPMACSAAQGQQMVDAAARAGVVLMAAQHQRFEPSYRAVRRSIATGALGDIYAARFDCMQNLRAYASPGHWLYDGDIAGGGIMISVGVHRLDLLRFLLDDEVTRVQAVTRARDPAFIHGAEDYAAGTLEFGRGTIVEFFGAYSGYRMPYGESFMIFGERGAVHALPPVGHYVGPALVARDGQPETPPLHTWLDQYAGFTPLDPVRDDLPTDNPMENEALHFAACCRAGARPLSDGRDNVRTLAVVDAIYESARIGAPVRPCGA